MLIYTVEYEKVAKYFLPENYQLSGVVPTPEYASL